MVMMPDTINGSYEKGRVKGAGELNPTLRTRELHGDRWG